MSSFDSVEIYILSGGAVMKRSLLIIMMLCSLAFAGEKFSITEKIFYGFSWPEYKIYNEARSIRKNVQRQTTLMELQAEDEEPGWRKTYISKETEMFDNLREYYENRFGTDRAVAYALLKTAEEYQKSIMEIQRLVHMETCPEEVLTDGEIDVKTTSMVKDIGFRNKSGNWYYDGIKVNMGKPRPVPASVKKYPRQNKVVYISFKPHIYPSKKRIARIHIETNLPEGFRAYASLQNERIDSLEYRDTSAVVRNGAFEMFFGTSDNPLEKGLYSFSMRTAAMPITQDDKEVLKKVGNHGEFLCGRYSYLPWGLGNQLRVKKLFLFEVR